MQVVYQQTILLENSCSTLGYAGLTARIMQSDQDESFKMPVLHDSGVLSRSVSGVNYSNWKSQSGYQVK
jgi:hypothetical protein